LRPPEGQAFFAAELVSCSKKHSLLFAMTQIKSARRDRCLSERKTVKKEAENLPTFHAAKLPGKVTSCTIA